MWNNKVKHQTHRNRVKKWFPGMGGGKNRERSKPPAMEQISPEELKYNIMTMQLSMQLITLHCILKFAKSGMQCFTKNKYVR